jgi:hypothetical protein
MIQGLALCLEPNFFHRSIPGLDIDLSNGIGSLEIVRCWGVAHHTGARWAAIESLLPHVSESGTLVLAIYNDQQYISRLWSAIKQIYQRLSSPLKIVWAAMIGLVLLIKRLSITLIAFRSRKPEAVFRFMRDRGFALQEIVTVSGHGCNEFVFRRRPDAAH